MNIAIPVHPHRARDLDRVGRLLGPRQGMRSVMWCADVDRARPQEFYKRGSLSTIDDASLPKVLSKSIKPVTKKMMHKLRLEWLATLTIFWASRVAAHCPRGELPRDGSAGSGDLLECSHDTRCLVLFSGMLNCSIPNLSFRITFVAGNHWFFELEPLILTGPSIKRSPTRAPTRFSTRTAAPFVTQQDCAHNERIFTSPCRAWVWRRARAGATRC
jgi:hypothetical protein